MSGAAIATKKPNTSEQLTFPAVFQEVYDKPLAYAPSGMGPRMTPYAGDDFQAKYHEQKKHDADYMARAKVMATTNARHKYVVSPHGYFGMPKPELSQRVFANPSGGALSIYSARQDGSVDAPFEMAGGLSGGVLRTAEGQGYAKARLQARIRQLDAIAAAKQDFATGATGTTLKPSGPSASTAEVTATTKTELQLILQSIIDALYGATEGNVEDAGVEEGETEEIEGKDAYESVSRIVFNDAVRALSIIIRTASAPETTAEDLEDILAPVNQIEQLLLSLTDPDYVEQAAEARTQLAKRRLITTQQLFQRIHQYLEEMAKGINLSPKERVALSKALVKKFGFTRFARDLADARTSEQGALERTARSRLFDASGRQAMDDEDDDDNDDFFNRPAERREDAEQRSNVATFDSNERDVFGDNSGEFLAYPTQGRPQRARFIEDAEMGPTAEAAVEEEFKTDEATGRRDFGRPATTGLTAEDVSRIRGEPLRRRRSAMASPQLTPIVEAVRSRASVRTAPSTSTRSTRKSRREPPPRPPRISRPPPPTPLALPPAQFRQQTAPSVSSRSTRSTPLPSAIAPKKRRLKPAPTSAAAASAAAASAAAAPTFRTAPDFRAEIDAIRSLADAQAFANAVNSMTPIPTTNGQPIKIYADSKIANVRRNFRRRFGL